MCCGGSSGSLSRLGISVGLLSLITLVTAFVSNVWLYTKEPITLPNSQILTTITFRIGFWRVCPSLKKPNFSQPTPSPACSLIKYSTWDEIKEADLGIFWSSLEFAPNFITRMRYSMPFEAVAVVIMLFATMFALIGHCNSDHKTLIACGLYTLGGLSLAGGLVVFASVLSDAYTDRPRRSFTIDNSNNVQFGFDYRYGWSFIAAGAAFILAEIAALISITAYLRRFPSVEEMVRVMVPGAERKLRQHYQHSDYLIRRNSCNAKPETIQKTETLISNDLEGCDGPLLRTKTPPDICTTNNKNVLEEPNVEYPNLAGTTVPITLMHHKPNTHYNNNSTSGQQTTLLFPSQDFRYATIASCTLVHQGMLGVSEGAAGTSSSSGSSASSGMLISNNSSISSRNFHHVPRVRKTAINTGFTTLDSRDQHKRSFSPSSASQGYCSSGSAV